MRRSTLYSSTLASGTRRRQALSIAILAALLIQVLPFAFSPALLAPEFSDAETKHFFKPLQVCDTSSDAGGFLTDIPWISPTPLVMNVPPTVEYIIATIGPSRLEVTPSLVYRPPRPVSLFA